MATVTFLFQRNMKYIDKILHREIVTASPFKIKRAVVLSKMTRYDVEKLCNPTLNKKELEKLVRSRGANYKSLMEHHQRHKDYEQYVLQTFNDKGIDSKLLTRSEYNESWIAWCDAVFPIGGDGTYLLAASKVRQNNKPVIGFNSDPENSEGFLCLPKKYSKIVKDVLLKLEEGKFSWLSRARIRVTLNRNELDVPQEPQDKRVLGIHRTQTRDLLGVKHMSSQSSQLPALALNEVFIGEHQSAQVTYLEMQLLVPKGERTKIKSSGLCLSTGTGATSWHLSLNRITPQCVNKVLQCAGVTEIDSYAVANKYNDDLLFDPEEKKMCYTIRDLISAGVWPSPPGLASRGFAQTILVQSHCRDAGLNIDGGVSYSFNSGSEACFSLHSEDTLRTVVL